MITKMYVSACINRPSSKHIKNASLKPTRCRLRWRYILEYTASGRTEWTINTSDRYQFCITGSRLRRRHKWPTTPASDVREGYSSREVRCRIGLYHWAASHAVGTILSITIELNKRLLSGCACSYMLGTQNLVGAKGPNKVLLDPEGARLLTY